MEESKDKTKTDNNESQGSWVVTSSSKTINSSTNDQNERKSCDLENSEGQLSAESSNNTSSISLFSKSSNGSRIVIQVPNSNSGSTMHPALKTSLSDVLRKNMAMTGKSKLDKKKDKLDSDTKAEVSNLNLDNKNPIDPKMNEKGQSNKIDTTLQSSYSISNLLKPDVPYSVKTFPATGGARKCVTPLASQPEGSKTSNDDIPSTELNSKTDNPTNKTEKILGSAIKNSQGKSATPDENSTMNQNTNVKTTKVKKRRHFRGGTYGLYLSKQTKKAKRKVLKKSDVSSRDDEVSLASTENGSCVDSEDGSSMFSDFTPSELSLADDEACSSSRCSPVPLSTDNPTEVSNFKDPPIENITPAPEVTETEKEEEETFPKMSETPEEEENKNVEEEETITTVLDTDKKESYVENSENNIQNEKDEADNVALNVNGESENYNTTENITEVKKPHDSARKTFRSSLSRNKLRIRQETLVKSRHRFRNFSRKLSSNISNQSDENGDFSKDIKEDDGSESNNASTIATSVKSRQRMRRRFTDDIVDTDLGLLSLNTTMTTCKKSKICIEPQIQQAVHIPDLVPTFSEFVEKYSSIPRNKSITKAEFILNSKKPPTSNCCCWEDGILLTVRKEESAVQCQAIDSIDEKNVGCCNPVKNYPLVRPATRVPFTVMCDMHLWRLKNHHCCPRCGRFCTQGSYMRCSGFNNSGKIHHLFHEQCFGETERNTYCLHCGNDSMLKVIHLELSISSSPSCLLYSDYYKTNPTARMGAPAPYKSKGGSGKNVKVLKVNDKEISSVSILPVADQRILENMLIKLSDMREEDIPNYPIHELYTAALEGSAYEVLYMLAHGISPNTKFSDYNSETALHAAGKSGSVIIAHLLVQAGCCIDAINDLLQTAIMIATEHNQVSVVEYLVYMKANVDLRNESGMTCLHIASKEGNIELCEVLLRSLRIDLNLQDEGGWTAVVWASEHAHANIVQLLLEKGADPNIRDKEGNTALHWASFSGNPNICDICLKYGCNINEANIHGDTPLHIAARQDNSTCVEFLLSMRAFTDIKNKAQQLPIDCCGSESASRRALHLNSMLLQLFKKNPETVERIVCSDIAMGKEKIPIQCVNWFDDENLISKDFLYVVENCETGPIKMDRSITALQCCECTTDCGSTSCTCGNVSFKCWYDKEGKLVPEFNMCDPPMLFECNRACLCDASSCRNRVVQKGLVCRLQLFRTAGKGWGVRTLKDIPKGTFICEYVGELITDSEADKRQDDSYLFDLDNRDGDTYCLDARHFGNISRFINHLCEPNLVPVKVFVDYQDLSFPRIAFFSVRDIQQYEELGFDYGEKFWVIKSKWFTCNCASPGCKYSSETIQETLANYSRKNREEQNESTVE